MYLCSKPYVLSIGYGKMDKRYMRFGDILYLKIQILLVLDIILFYWYTKIPDPINKSFEDLGGIPAELMALYYYYIYELITWKHE